MGLTKKRPGHNQQKAERAAGQDRPSQMLLVTTPKRNRAEWDQDQRESKVKCVFVVDPKGER
jgi:hypothetical protein